MVDQVNILYEGHRNLRPGFHRLFKAHVERARDRRIRFNLIAGGARAEAVKDFLRYCQLNPSHLNVLLIDSEAPVSSTTSAIRSLRTTTNQWDAEIADDDSLIHFMVQTMEAWFVSDPQALVNYFGRNFNTNGLPNPQNAEVASPSELISGIKRGLRNIGRPRTYDKVADGMKLLQLVDENTVRNNCPHFRRLSDFLAANV